MSKIKNGGLDQYGAEPFEQQKFGTAGVEGVNFSAPCVRLNESSRYVHDRPSVCLVWDGRACIVIIRCTLARI